jgi:hypothetical protein
LTKSKGSLRYTPAPFDCFVREDTFMVARSLAPLFSTANSAQVDPSRLSESSVPHALVLKAVSLALVAGIGYYVGTRVGFALTPTGQPNSAFWPPNAILLACLLLAPRRIWWALLVAVIPAHFLAQLQAGVPAWTAGAWLASNTSEALIGGRCRIRRCADHPWSERVRFLPNG